MTIDSEIAVVCEQRGCQEIWQCVTRCVCYSRFLWRL